MFIRRYNDESVLDIDVSMQLVSNITSLWVSGCLSAATGLQFQALGPGGGGFFPSPVDTMGGTGLEIRFLSLQRFSCPENRHDNSCNCLVQL